MFYWVCVNDMPAGLPTSDVEAAKRLAIDQIEADASAHVYIDVHSRNSPSTRLLYNAASNAWIRTDALVHERLRSRLPR